MQSILSREWDIHNIFTREKVNDLKDILKVEKMTAKLLLARGYRDAADAYAYMHPDNFEYHNPFLLPDMEKATEQILKAADEGKKVLIYGDYDVDGVTGTSLLYLFLKNLISDIRYYIPDRIEDGYGLSQSAVCYIEKEIEPDLIITVDCGVSSVNEAEYLSESGIDLIITDHHECPEILPKAAAIINPGRADSLYPNRNLAGAGVALKLVHALGIKKGRQDSFRNYLDLAAIGTIADLAELTGENRHIAKDGLKMIKNSKNIGITELIRVSGLTGKKISSYHIGFQLGPRINAAGRLENASKAIEMFITDDKNAAFETAIELDKNNMQRQEYQQSILDKAIDEIEKNDYHINDRVIVVSGEGWHQGVIGIVASKITEKYYRPSLILAEENGILKGSGRSIDGFNLYAALDSLKEIFVKFGGHEMAAGFSLEKEKLSELRSKINHYAEENIASEVFVPKQKADTILEIGELSIESIEQLELFEPYGIGNPSPVFCMENLCVIRQDIIGKKKEHLKLMLKKDNTQIEAIAFNFAEYANEIMEYGNIDILFNPSVNNWRDRKRPQLIIRDIKKTGKVDLKNIFFHKNNKNIDLIINNVDNSINTIYQETVGIVVDEVFFRLTREKLVALYKYIKKIFNKDMATEEFTQISTTLDNETEFDFIYINIRHGMEIFKELGIMDIEFTSDDRCIIKDINADKKYSLEDSDLFRRLSTITESGG